MGDGETDDDDDDESYRPSMASTTIIKIAVDEGDEPSRVHPTRKI